MWESNLPKIKLIQFSQEQVGSEIWKNAKASQESQLGMKERK